MEEERKTIIDIVVDSFGKMVKSFKEHGFLLATYVFMLFLILYSFIINPININSLIEKRFAENKAEREYIEDRAFEKRLHTERVLMPILDNIVETNPDIQRAMILEAHNGVLSKGRLDILYLTCTFESIASDSPHLELIGDSFQRQPINGMLSGGLSSIMYKKYIYKNDSNGGSSRLYRKFKTFGCDYVMIIPICDENDIPLSLLVLTSNKPFAAEEEYNKLASTIHSLKSLLIDK